MTMMDLLQTGIDFAKEKIDKVMDIWDGFDDDKKKLLIGCAIAAVSVIVVASIAYSIGKNQGRRIAFEEEDF